MTRFLCRKADQMVGNRSADIRNRCALICTAEVIIKIVYDTSVSAAMTARNGFLRFLHGNLMVHLVREGANMDLLIGHEGIQLALGAENARITAAFVEGIES